MAPGQTKSPDVKDANDTSYIGKEFKVTANKVQVKTDRQIFHRGWRDLPFPRRYRLRYQHRIHVSPERIQVCNKGYFMSGLPKGYFVSITALLQRPPVFMLFATRGQ